MLSQREANAHPEIQRLVKDILLENSRYKRELRSFHREVLVCPVMVEFAEEVGIESQHCVSRNISAAGVSLISSVEFPERVMGTMEIYRLKKTFSSLIIAECRWCKPVRGSILDVRLAILTIATQGLRRQVRFLSRRRCELGG